MKIGVIGSGNMSEAILAALLARKTVSPDDLVLADADADRLAGMAARYSARAAASNAAAAEGADAVILGVKPQQLEGVLRELHAAAAPRGLFLSIAAGKRLAWIERRLPLARIIRVMPNLACRAGAAMSVFCPGCRAGEDDRETARKLLSACGLVMELAEEHFDTVTAVSGAGPAFFARMTQAMASAAAAGGIPPEQALLLAAQTMRGTAALLIESAMTPDEVVAAVSSAKGVTVAGLAEMERRGFDAAVRAAVDAAARRGRELAGESA